MTFRPTVSGWVPPFPQIINRATGQSCCCPAFRQQIFLKCKSLSPLAVPRTIFLLSVHVQTWRKPAGLSQITVPSQRAMGAFHPRSNLCQERKEKKRNGVKKVSQVHLCPKSNGLQRFWMKKKSSTGWPVIFNTALWGERLVMDRSSVWERSGHQWKCSQLCSESETALGEIHPLSLFDSNALSCIDFFSSPFPLQILIDEFVCAASWRGPLR